MTAAHAAVRRPLRLWPGVVLASLEVLLFLGVPIVAPDQAIIGLLGAVACGALVLVWWLFFSRAPWLERIGAIVLMVAGVMALTFVVDPSIAGAGQGRLLYVLPLPLLALALVVGAVAGERASIIARRASLAAAILLACGAFTLIRTEGVRGAGGFDFRWRWTPTAEDRLLAKAGTEPDATAAAVSSPIATTPASPNSAASAVTSTPASAAAGVPSPARLAANEPASPTTRPAMIEPEATRVEWPGFRGPTRDDVVPGVRIETDWVKNPPVALWRQPIGPGWSSFAVQGDLIYTQEQRGDHELVSCYNRTNGQVVWRHRDAVRFYESNGGAGPRATPTISHGRVFTFGATGIVNALDARTGALVWTRNASTEANVKLPTWAFTSSPLVVDDIVIVAAAGRLIGFDRATGSRRWLGPVHGVSYSSPHLATIDGTPQVLLLSAFGVTSVAPADGKVLWEHEWSGGAIVQPAITSEGDVLVNSISMMGGLGVRRLAVSHRAGAWTAQERWTTNGLKPYFSDFVVHKGHAFGFDGNILSCIDLSDGKRVWKGGRYGAGQMLLLPDQDALLVLSEEGELALVSATADKFTELARLPGIEGKTWNHPVLIGDVLLVRNGQEMAAFRLKLADR